jgi:O-methyltransferase involved in polyketide biosynthesis
MKDKIKIELGEVQKTLLIPLWGRAKEYENKNALIKDKYAHEIVEQLDFDFSVFSEMSLRGPLQVNTSIRAYNFDTTILKIIKDYPDATIINIGAGLDTTFKRVDNGKIFWYDIDLPDTIALREQILPEGARNKIIAKSVFDRSWFQEIKVRGSKVFFMAAGVLAYLDEKDIRDLFADMAKEFPGSEMMFEIYSRQLLWVRNRNIEKEKKEGKVMTSMQWGVNSAREIAKWGSHIKIADEYSFYSKVNLDDHWDKKVIAPLRVINFFKAIKMVHLSFQDKK